MRGKRNLAQLGGNILADGAAAGRIGNTLHLGGGRGLGGVGFQISSEASLANNRGMWLSPLLIHSRLSFLYLEAINLFVKPT